MTISINNRFWFKESFGAVMYSSLSEQTKETFTGKELDSETGRYYFGARYYDAALGSWSVTDPAGQFASPYAYSANSPHMLVDRDGQLAWFAIPLAVGIAAGTYSGVKTYQQTGDLVLSLTQGVISGAKGFTYSAAGASLAGAGSATGASSTSQAGFAIASNAATEASYTALSGGSNSEIGRAAFVGAAQGLLGIKSLQGIANKSLYSKLGLQALNTSTRSIGNNWVNSRKLLSSVDVGIGPVNLTIRDRKVKYLSGKNIGNIAVHGLGFANTFVHRVIYGAKSDAFSAFDMRELSFHFAGGFIRPVQNLFFGPAGGATGLHAVLSGDGLTNGHYQHEINHIWQSRFFNHNYLPIWILGGLNSIARDKHFNNPYNTLNYFESNAGIF